MSPFADHVDGMPDFGQSRGWRLSEFKGRETVRIDRLISTNRGRYLDERRVAKYARSGSGCVYLVKHQGRYYIADGHHTAAAAALRGEKTVRARVKTVR